MNFPYSVQTVYNLVTLSSRSKVISHKVADFCHNYSEYNSSFIQPSTMGRGELSPLYVLSLRFLASTLIYFGHPTWQNLMIGSPYHSIIILLTH